jgi:hypothetical protein
MGVVHLARHVETGQEVALKTVRLAQRRNLAGLRAEIRALATLRHPGIVGIADFGVENGAPWYAMELLRGQNLGEYVSKLWLDARGHDAREVATISDVERDVDASAAVATGAARPIAPATRRPMAHTPAAHGHVQELLRITAELCRALSYLHGNGLLHGDLKPSNIFVCNDGRVVLLDFGLVAQARGGFGREALETAGAVRGTIPYLAPERLRGDFADARADLFGVGVMLFEALTGQLPFRGARAADILGAQQAGLFAPPSHLVADVPPELDRLVKELLAFSPQDRLGHAEDVVATLESLGVAPAPAARVDGAKTTYLYRPPLAGRGKVVEQLVARLETARSGQGGIVLLTGESGVGKTAIMAELGRRATQRHLTVVNGECIPIGAGSGAEAEIKEAPLHPFRGLLQDIADRCSEWSAATVEALLGSRARLLARYEPSLGTIPGIERFAGVVELPADASRERLLRELRALLEALPTMTGPILLLIDDLQWADEVSIHFLRSLSALFFRRVPVLVVATVRGDEMNASVSALAAAEGVESIAIASLDEAAVEEMVGGMLSMASPPRSLVQVLARHSEGNPFFVAEYLRLAVEERAVVRQAGRWRVSVGPDESANTFDGLSLPVSIRELLGRRLEGLGSDAREVVDVAAVIGRTFENGLLAEVVGIDEGRSLERLRAPMSLNIVQDGGGGVLRFAHDKLREAAYAALSPERKRDLHARVATRIESRCAGDRAALTERSAELVHHFKLAQDAASALRYLELAGEASLGKSAHSEAASFLEDAIAVAARAELQVTPDRRARWEKMIGDAYLALGKHDVSRAHFNVALASLGAPIPSRKGALVAALLRAIGLQVAHRFGLRDLPSSAHADSALLLEKAQIHDRLLQIYYYTGAELPQMLHAMTSSLNLAELAGPSPYLALGYVNAGATAGIIPARGLADRYFSLARAALDRHPNQEIESFVNLLEGHYRFGCGESARASALFTGAMAIAERMGFVRRWEENASLHRCLLVATGRFVEAQELNAKILASVTRGDRQIQCWELIGRAQVQLVTGDPGLALQDAKRAVELSAEQSRAEKLRSHGALASALLRCGDREGARRAADVAWSEIIAGPPLGPYWLDAYCDVADVRFAFWNEGSAARDAVKRAVRTLEKFVSAFPVAAARVAFYKGKWLARSGQPSKAREAWARGAALAEAADLRYDLAINEVALATALDARDPERQRRFDRGRELLGAIGAVPDAGALDALAPPSPPP